MIALQELGIHAGIISPNGKSGIEKEIVRTVIIQLPDTCGKKNSYKLNERSKPTPYMVIKSRSPELRTSEFKVAPAAKHENEKESFLNKAIPPNRHLSLVLTTIPVDGQGCPTKPYGNVNKSKDQYRKDHMICYKFDGSHTITYPRNSSQPNVINSETDPEPFRNLIKNHIVKEAAICLDYEGNSICQCSTCGFSIERLRDCRRYAESQNLNDPSSEHCYETFLKAARKEYTFLSYY